MMRLEGGLMQINRLFEIVYLLIVKKSITAKELAAQFEVSTRTILRDIEVLSSAGVPIYTKQGKGGGISLLDGYVLNKALFSDDEQHSILLALQGLSKAGNIEIQPVINKLKALFVRQNADWLEIDFTRFGKNDGDKEKFEAIKTSIISSYALEFSYSNARGQTALRKIYPLKLLFKSLAWYVQGYCTEKNDYRMFKLSRMRHVKRLGKTFDSSEFKLPPMHMGSANNAPIEIKLLLPATLAYRVYDEFDEEAITQNTDGFIVRANLPDGYWLFDYLLSFGSDIIILEPPELRDKFYNMAQKIMKNHSDKT